ncbi:hypothetical protein BJP36_41845 [Moorena producens JHB]|uniref:Uncharacterized protein n=1 Tax=Moorena producens (strain JHB) TaxID=1454205 RepID=A0A9Q9SSN8_MOOP1|nr:hypothetical protein [Moorena producens]WAN68910.1 hypothetical protein BJP36_41845 [Moorena producens JHB]
MLTCFILNGFLLNPADSAYGGLHNYQVRFPHLIIKFATGRTSGTQDCFPTSDFRLPCSLFPVPVIRCSLFPKIQKFVPN